MQDQVRLKFPSVCLPRLPPDPPAPATRPSAGGWPAGFQQTTHALSRTGPTWDHLDFYLTHLSTLYPPCRTPPLAQDQHRLTYQYDPDTGFTWTIPLFGHRHTS